MSDEGKKDEENAKVFKLAVALKQKQEKAARDAVSTIDPVIDQLEGWKNQVGAVFDPAGGVFSTQNEETGERMSLKPIQVMRRLKYTYPFPPSIPSEPERILAAIEVYTERERATALLALQKRLLIDPRARDGKPRGHHDLKPLQRVFTAALPELAKDATRFNHTVNAVAHIMQNVKRKIGGKRDRDVMAAITFSPLQGTGKTEFWRRFCKPIAPFFFEDSFGNLFEKFGFMPWTLYYVLCADEMAIPRKEHAVEISEVKRRMSEEIISNRGMQTELNCKHVRRATVVGTCNKHPREIVGDENGRRFLPIDFGAKVYRENAHNPVNDVTTVMINDAWRSLDELGPSCAAETREEIQISLNKEMRPHDWVDEAFDEILVARVGGDDRWMLQSAVRAGLREYHDHNCIRAKIPTREQIRDRLIARGHKADRNHPDGKWVVWGCRMAEAEDLT